MVITDTTILLLMIRPETPVPAGRDGFKIDGVKERIEQLIKTLESSRTKIAIPTPALAEALVRAGMSGSQEIVERLQKSSAFQIVPFDERAAIEVAAMTRDAIARGHKKENPKAVWAKVKYDRQIVAIAKVCGATAIYSDDADIRAIAKANSNIPVIGLANLPLPPSSPQQNLPLDGAHSQSNVPAGQEDVKS